MGYFDWNNIGRLDSIYTTMELRMLEEVQKQEDTHTEDRIFYNLVATIAVLGIFLSVISF